MANWNQQLPCKYGLNCLKKSSSAIFISQFKDILCSILLQVVPFGFRKILNWLKNTYDNPHMFITEAGFSDDGRIDDYARVNNTRVSIH